MEMVMANTTNVDKGECTELLGHLILNKSWCWGHSKSRL
jgi:hypothetical protein